VRRAAALRLLAAFALVFLATRLVHLMALPPFADETIHVDWALKVAQTGRLLGISDGGRYLPIWLDAVVASRASDPVKAVRMLSVVFGLAAAVALAWLGRVVYDERAGLLAAVFYLLIPGALLYDRMALAESLLAALVLLGLGASARWAQSGRLAWGLLAGVVVGAAAITKLYGALLVLAPPLCALAFRPPPQRRGLWAQLPAVHGAALGVMLPVLLELQATAQFVVLNAWPFHVLPARPVSLLHNLRLAVIWQVQYLTPLVAILVLAAILHALRRRAPGDRVLLPFWAAWTAFFVITGGHDWFPRYLFPVLPPLLLVAAQRIVQASDRLAEALAAPRWRAQAPALVAGLVLLSCGRTDWQLLTDPARAALPGLDRWQYVTDWPSGYRLGEVASFLEGAGQAIILRDYRSGPLLEGLNLRLRRDRLNLRFTDVDLRREGFAVVAARLSSSPAPVMLALEQPVAHRLLLALDGHGLARPLAFFVKPGRLRGFEIHCVAGSCPMPDEPPRPSAPLPALRILGIDEPGAIEEARRCSASEGDADMGACLRALGLGLTPARAAEVEYELGGHLAVERRYEEAIAAYREAVRLLPSDVDQSLAYAAALEALGRHDEALAVVEDARRFAPEEPEVWAHLGWNLAHLGRAGEAEVALREALARAPQHAGLHSDLGVVLLLTGRGPEAVAELRQAVSLEAEGLRQRYNLGVAIARPGSR
jgi:Flp pilus assembly protein TadD